MYIAVKIHSTDVSGDTMALERKRCVVTKVLSQVLSSLPFKTLPLSQQQHQLSSAILTASDLHPQKRGIIINVFYARCLVCMVLKYIGVSNKLHLLLNMGFMQ